MSHHFFSWRENLKNSLRSDHMECFEFMICPGAGKANHRVRFFHRLVVGAVAAAAGFMTG